jgi:hypothetical protein
LGIVPCHLGCAFIAIACGGICAVRIIKYSSMKVSVGFSDLNGRL